MPHNLVRIALASSLLAVIAAAPPAAPQPKAEKLVVGKLQRKTFDKEGKTKLDYLLYLPRGYDKITRDVPLVLFLHGKGDKLTRMERGGLPKQVERKKDQPFILVAPECPGRGWSPRDLAPLLDDVTSTYRVDKDRVYVTGLSMGGFGTWSLAAAYPDRFAAIIPICGGGNPTAARKIKDLPIWVFHGVKDDIVPIARSVAMVNALEKAGAKGVKFTKYPEAKHDSWSETYRNPKVWEWLLSQKRGKKE
jgi:predicted peptidase